MNPKIKHFACARDFINSGNSNIKHFWPVGLFEIDIAPNSQAKCFILDSVTLLHGVTVTYFGLEQTVNG